MKVALIVSAYVVGAFLVVRAVVEIATIDYGDASSYRDDWVARAWRACSLCTACPV